MKGLDDLFMDSNLDDLFMDVNLVMYLVDKGYVSQETGMVTDDFEPNDHEETQGASIQQINSIIAKVKRIAAIYK